MRNNRFFEVNERDYKLVKRTDLNLTDWQAVSSPCYRCQQPRLMRYVEDDNGNLHIYTFCDMCGLCQSDQWCVADSLCHQSDMQIRWNGKHLSMTCRICGAWQTHRRHADVGIIGQRKDKRTINVKAKQRYAILTRDNSRCQICGITAKDATLHVDHKVSVSEAKKLGWSETQINADDNLWTLCETCNLGKGTQSL